MVATFDGDALTEPLSSVHTDETTPQGLVLHPAKKHLVCIFSGDVAVYDVEFSGNALAENEESDAPSPAESSPVTLTPRSKDGDDDGVAERITLAEGDIKCAAFDPGGETLAIGLESGEVQLCTWPALEVTKTLGKHADAVTGIAFSPDGKFILTTSAEPANKPDKGAAVWSVVGPSRPHLLSLVLSVTLDAVHSLPLAPITFVESAWSQTPNPRDTDVVRTTEIKTGKSLHRFPAPTLLPHPPPQKKNMLKKILFCMLHCPVASS